MFEQPKLLRVWSTVCYWRIRPNFLCNINSPGTELASPCGSCANAKKKKKVISVGTRRKAFWVIPIFRNICLTKEVLEACLELLKTKFT